MSAPPILACADWPQLASVLAKHDSLRGLADLRPALAAAVLAAPAAIARSIALHKPQLASRDELSILVIGAETTDAPDEGRWYQAVSAMLGTRPAVHVTLAGASLTQFASAAAHGAPALRAHCVRSGLAEFLDAHADKRFDVAAVFQPGLQKYRHWLEDRGFAWLLAAGTLMIGSSYAADEYQMERWVLECYGYRASEEPLQNPFYLDLGDAKSSIRWGSMLWQIEAAPPPAFAVDTQKLASLETLNRMVLHSLTVVGSPAPPCGAAVELTAGNGLRKSMIHVFDGRFLDPRDATLLKLDAQGQLHALGRLPQAELSRYPRAASREIERAIWAADIKERFLLQSYPAGGDAAAGAAITGDMFATMRRRAEALFR